MRGRLNPRVGTNPNIARRAQAFEIWIRPVVPANAHMSLRVALHELGKLVNNGLSQETSRPRANDSWWYGTPEYTSYVRSLYAKLTRDDVRRALETYLWPEHLNVVIVTKDAQGLRDALVAEARRHPGRGQGHRCDEAQHPSPRT